MTDGVHDLIDAHACACNGQVWETLRPFWGPRAHASVDGKWLGDGPQAIRQALKAWDDGLVARVVESEGQRVLMGYDGAEGEGKARVMVRLETDGGRIAEFDVHRLLA